MPNYDEKPTLDFITGFRDYFRGVWQSTHDQWRDDDAYYDSTFQVWPERLKSRPVSYTSVAAGIINHAADAMLTSTPSFHREPSARGGSQEADASAVENTVQAAFTAMGMRNPVPPFKLFNIHLALYGYAILDGVRIDLSGKPRKPTRKEGESAEDWKDREDQFAMEERNWMPYRLTAPHPASVLMDPEEKQPPAALQMGYRSATDLHAMTLAEKARGTRVEVWSYDPKKPFQLFRVWDFWTRRWHVVLVGEAMQILYTKRNMAGFMPLTHAYAGWGHRPVELLATDPVPWARGLLWAVKPDIKRDTQRISARHKLTINAAFAPMATRPGVEAARVAEAINREKLIEELEPGDLFWPEQAKVEGWIFKEGEEGRRDIENATYTRELSGLKLEGPDTLGQQAMRSHQMYLKFETANQQLAELVTIAAGNFLRLVDVGKKPVTVRGVTLKPEQIHHDYSIIATFRASDPIVKLQEQQLAQADANAVPPKISDMTYREKAGYTDEEKESKRLLRQDVLRTPEIHAMFVEVEAAKMGLEKLMHEIEKMQEEQKQLLQRREALGGGGNGVAELRQPISEKVPKPPRPNLAGLGGEDAGA